MFNLGLFLSYAIIVSFTPGPNNIMSLYNASQKGFRKNVGFSLGVSSGFFIIMMICIFFNYWIQSVLPTVKPFMSALGAVYMLYLAYKIYNSKPPQNIEASSNKIINYKTGLLMQFVNPKAILYGITIVSNFITPYFSSPLILFLFAVFLAFIAILSTSLWASFGYFFTRLLNKYYKPFNIAMSCMLLYTAISILKLS